MSLGRDGLRKGQVMKAISYWCVLVLGLVAPCAGWACVGARPLAMGVAFVAVADDVEATYWNPAGLAQLLPGRTESTFMHTATNRNAINYQDYFAVATRFAPRASGRPGGYALGASYISNKQFFEDRQNRIVIEDDEQWLWVSGAIELAPRMMIGVNARAVIDNTPAGYPLTTEPAFDVGYLYRANDKLSFGLLIQDANQPHKKFSGIAFAPYVRNWRPGIAYRPTAHSVIALDGYDVANEGGARSFRVGGEIEFDRYTVRAGFYGFGGSGVPRSVTFGLGMRHRRGSLDLAILSGDLDNTVILSGTVRLD